MTDPLVDVTIRLMDKPDAGLEEFMKHVTAAFSEPVAFGPAFGPADVPAGHEDPVYWAVSFSTSIDEHKVDGQCNRIGRESDLLLRASGARGINASKLSADLFDPQKTLQGWWQESMSAFADDAVARLDCSLNTGQYVDATAIGNELGTIFTDVQFNDDLLNLLNSGVFEIEASGGVWEANRRLDNALIRSHGRLGTQFTVTSWLRTPNS